MIPVRGAARVAGRRRDSYPHAGARHFAPLHDRYAALLCEVCGAPAVLVATAIGSAFDSAVLEGVKRTATPPAVAVMRYLTRLGDEFIVGALPLVLLRLWRRRLRQQAAEVLIARPDAQLLNDALKLVFHRPRRSVFVSVIPGQAFRFPSSHAMVSDAFYGALAVIGWRVLRGRTRIALLTAMTAVVFLVG
jgi:membrane-associated phospholipid phosphatase